jgi:hypothetical protein
MIRARDHFARPGAVTTRRFPPPWAEPHEGEYGIGLRLFLRCVISATPIGCIILAQSGECAAMRVIFSIIGQGLAITIAGGGAFVIASYALDWL